MQEKKKKTHARKQEILDPSVGDHEPRDVRKTKFTRQKKTQKTHAKEPKMSPKKTNISPQKTKKTRKSMPE